MSALSSIVLAGVVAVSSADGLKAAVANAAAGDEIVLADGVYRIATLSCDASGPVVVRAKTPLAARIEVTGDAVVVQGSAWRFEGLEVQGICAAGSGCAHAFAVSANGAGFVAHGNRLIDFDAQIEAHAPSGTVEANEIFDTHPRATSNDVAKIAIEAGDGWSVRANTVRDFRRDDGATSRGIAFAAGTSNAVIERNLVVCTRDEGRSGSQVAIALDGHVGATVRNNIVANCAGPALLASAAPAVKLDFNTFIATSGISLVGVETGVVAHANLLDAPFTTAGGAAPAAESNDVAVDAATLAAMYVAPALGDLRKKGDLSAVIGQSPDSAGVTDDFCGRPRGAAPFDVGAIEHSLGDCRVVEADAGADASIAIADGPDSPAGRGHDDGMNGSADDAPAPAHGGCDVSHRGGEPTLAALLVGLLTIARRHIDRGRSS